jgi:hypothetical protein
MSQVVGRRVPPGWMLVLAAAMFVVGVLGCGWSIADGEVVAAWSSGVVALCAVALFLIYLRERNRPT